jgi:ATP-grasp domain, R2K clade family 3
LTPAYKHEACGRLSIKSRKHEWAEACYIPSAADAAVVERVVRRFLELQGDDLNEGLVFREFVPFEPLTTDSTSGTSLTREFRLFILDGEPILSAEYWEEGDSSGDVPPIGQFDVNTRRVRSRFFTMDVAKRVEGSWTIVELGDGQVAGLPDRADVNAFYRALSQRLA